MAVLNIKARKQLKDMERVIDLQEIGYDKITYKPLSKSVIDEYKRLQSEINDELQSRMVKLLKLDKKSLKGDIENAFIEKFDIEKLMEIHSEVAKKRNIVCEFMHTIDGVPEKKELLKALEDECGEELAMEAYLSLANIVYTEFQEALSELEKIVTPS